LRIPGPDDGKVAVEHTKVQGMKDFLLVHKTHTFMMRDKGVLIQIDHFLRTGTFRRGVDA
jgi:triacylglycerol lipase